MSSIKEGDEEPSAAVVPGQVGVDDSITGLTHLIM